MDITRAKQLSEILFSMKSPEGAGARARRVNVAITENPYAAYDGIDRYLKYREIRAHLWDRGWRRANTLLNRLSNSSEGLVIL